MRGKRAGKLSRLGSMDLCGESRLAKKAAETCKNAKEGEHLPNCGDDTS